MVKAAKRHNLPFLNSEPFRDWIETLVDEEYRDYDFTGTFQTGPACQLSPQARVAARLGISPRRLRDYRDKRRAWIREDAVDRACSHEGSIHIAELYPCYWDIAEAGGVRDLATTGGTEWESSTSSAT